MPLATLNNQQNQH